MNSLEDVYLMSWREFQLRLVAYKRMQRERHAIARQMTYYAGYALQVQKPAPIDKFWKIEGDKETITDDLKERMKQAMNREWTKVRQLQPK